MDKALTCETDPWVGTEGSRVLVATGEGVDGWEWSPGPCNWVSGYGFGIGTIYNLKKTWLACESSWKPESDQWVGLPSWSCSGITWEAGTIAPPMPIVPWEAEKTCAPVRTAGMICDITWRCFQPLFLKGLAPGCFSTYASQEAALSTVILQPVESFYVHPDTVTITVRTPALCLLDTLDKSFSLCLPYSSLTLCLIHTDNLTSLSIPPLVHYPCSTYDSFLITNTVVPCSLIHTSLCTYIYVYKPMYLDVEP